MKAVTFDGFGAPEVLQVVERSSPQPGPGEVVVAVTAATINPTDLMMLDGTQAPLMAGLKPPFIAGMEYSGHIAAIGQGMDLLLGTPVIGVINPRTSKGGAQAAQICVSAKSVAGVAPGMDLVSAATVPMNALTAMLALEMLALAPGQSVLVTGGAGMVGGRSPSTGVGQPFCRNWASAMRERIFAITGSATAEARLPTRPRSSGNPVWRA